MIQVLLEAGADISLRDGHGYTPLHYDAEFGRLPEVETLTRAGSGQAWRDEEGKTPLFLASMEGSAKIVRYLMKEGADPGTTDDSGLSAIGWAAKRGHMEFTKVLLTAGIGKLGMAAYTEALCSAAMNGDVRPTLAKVDGFASHEKSMIQLAEEGALFLLGCLGGSGYGINRTVTLQRNQWVRWTNKAVS